MFKKDKAVIIGDLHFPYHDPKSLNWALGIIKDTKPTHVIQIGDLYDFFWFSKYPKRFLEMGPDQEIQKGRRVAEAFWAKVQRLVPKAKCLQMLGNHDDRPAKRIMEQFPEVANLLNFNHLFQFPGVKTNLDSRQENVVRLNGKDIIFQHGHLSQLGAHMKFNQQSTVVGHSHRGGVVYQGILKEIQYELNCGFLADRSAGPLQYGPSKKKNWTLGVGMIDAYGPRFVPYG